MTVLHVSTYIVRLEGGKQQRQQQWLITLDLCNYILCYVRNKYCEQLPDVHMVNRNWKYVYCDRNLQYKIPHGTHESSGCLCALWSVVLIYSGNCEKKICLLEWKNLLTHLNNVELHIYFILLTNTALNTDRCKI